ncbi:MAG: GNAT family N-acetyltransferase [Bacteroidota bacterium]
MYEIITRKATINDLEMLFQFEQGVIEAERPYDTTLKNGLIHYYDLKEMIDAPHVEVIVAETNSKIIGSGYARIEKAKPYLKHDHHAYLGFMFVHPEHRGKGINKKIIEALKKWAISRDVKELRLDVYFDNISAIKAYEKIGFAKHMIEMRMSLLFSSLGHPSF